MKDTKLEKIIKDLAQKSGLSEKKVKEKGNNMAKAIIRKKPNFGTAPLPDDDW